MLGHSFSSKLTLPLSRLSLDCWMEINAPAASSSILIVVAISENIGSPSGRTVMAVVILIKGFIYLLLDSSQDHRFENFNLSGNLGNRSFHLFVKFHKFLGSQPDASWHVADFLDDIKEI